MRRLVGVDGISSAKLSAKPNWHLELALLKLKFHGTDTDTDFRDAPIISCNFVNVYTIVYHVQYTYKCTRAHPQRTSSRGNGCLWCIKLWVLGLGGASAATRVVGGGA